MVKLEVLTIIPARGGSKGLPRKNLHSFLGHPLIAFSIAAATQAKTVSRTIVTTDDEEIANVSKKYGAEVPFMRPSDLARDDTPDLPVFKHALGWLAKNEDYHPDIVIHLRPTSPVRPRSCVDDGVQLLMDHPEASSVRGVVPSSQNPHKMWWVDSNNGQMIPLLQVEGIAEPYNSPRQALPKTFWQTGHIAAIY
jgi:CMP-N-acetylneuraminic acid synthetase